MRSMKKKTKSIPIRRRLFFFLFCNLFRSSVFHFVETLRSLLFFGCSSSKPEVLINRYLKVSAESMGVHGVSQTDLRAMYVSRRYDLWMSGSSSAPCNLANVRSVRSNDEKEI